MKIKNKLTVTRGEEGDNRERSRRVKSRNMNRGPMDKDDGEEGRLNVGDEGRWVRPWRVMGVK